MTDGLISNAILRAKLHQEIHAAERQHRVTPDIMYLVEAVKEIERLNEALDICSRQTEDLFKFINERRGERIEIIRQMRSDDTSPRPKHFAEK